MTQGSAKHGNVLLALSLSEQVLNMHAYNGIPVNTINNTANVKYNIPIFTTFTAF